ncbi:hypothetical protein RhiirA5_413626 [Rhizophagus irregularis]|uniref:Uncharacterized protein n=1 Tax=Rhizophagus irregularis TaxID=588596 RepID=A0A2N0PW04_9GLOM|nr:hypothetical protein RhiirA5_413626 [Rhizophagus irregularis]GBC49001.2 hypothetical protein RIR_e6770_A0A2N0PW04_9GLOM [Rhizophagus irregularis DAOM 181602=DAOM 197198]
MYLELKELREKFETVFPENLKDIKNSVKKGESIDLTNVISSSKENVQTSNVGLFSEEDF